jgi:hypothetical protein
MATAVTVLVTMGRATSCWLYQRMAAAMAGLRRGVGTRREQCGGTFHAPRPHSLTPPFVMMSQWLLVAAVAACVAGREHGDSDLQRFAPSSHAASGAHVLNVTTPAGGRMPRGEAAVLPQHTDVRLSSAFAAATGQPYPGAPTLSAPSHRSWSAW